MDRRTFIKSTGLGIAALSLPRNILAQAFNAQNRPNIMVVMVDDMGFSDLGCYGGEIKTPNIDSIAKKGLRFTQFHNCARCCPTRASLLTGQYPHEVGLTNNGNSLTRNGITISELLKTAGYNTAMAGKWHLSFTPVLPGNQHQKWIDHQIEHSPFAPIESYPINRGFDKHFGIIWGVGNHFDPFSLVDGTEPVKDVPDDFYFTDAITDKAVEYLNDFNKSEKPFFLYYSHCAPHWPLHAKDEDIKKYKGKYDGGWEKLRKDRYQRQLDMGLFDKQNHPQPTLMDEGKKWNELPEKERAYQARKMEVHAAMIDCIDQNFGRVLDTLKKNGQFDNTLILFLSDNGASPESYPLPGYDRNEYTRDGEKILYNRNAPLDVIGTERCSCGIGPAWANAANTPFKYWKKESFEGGCNTPLIVHWPNGLKAKPGSVTDQTGHVMDIMATSMELAEARYPEKYNGHKLTKVRGKSLTPILKGKTRKGHDILFFEHEFGRSVIQGDWKLVEFSDRKQKWELYNLKKDATESNNLADKNPQKAEELRTKWVKWAKEVGLAKRYNL